MENLQPQHKTNQHAGNGENELQEMGRTLAPPAFALTASPPSNPEGNDENSQSGDILSTMGEAFGADFSGVNLIANSSKATEVEAQAFTQGNDVHFAPGMFNPHSQSGKELIGHELTHVLQQRSGNIQATQEVAGTPVNADTSLENEADKMGAMAARGEKVSHSYSGNGGSKGPVQRKSYSRMTKKEKAQFERFLIEFKHSFVGQKKPKASWQISIQDTHYQLEGKPTVSKTRTGKTYVYTYASSAGYKVSVVVRGKSAPVIGSVDKIGNGGGSLKSTRPDDHPYVWMGHDESAEKLGMSGERKIHNESQVPEGFVESHLSGKHNGLRYFKKMDASRQQRPSGSEDELLRAGYGTWSQEKQHTVNGKKRKEANTVMGVSATQYAGHMANASRANGLSNPQKVHNIMANNVAYQWCHLVGHGDGGNETPENFMAGTHYANTEQLALETAIRNFRGLDLTLKVTAFVPEIREGITVDAYFADHVKFAILLDGEPVYDHIFDMHGGSFDRREWNILQVECQEAIMAAVEGVVEENGYDRSGKYSKKSVQGYRRENGKSLTKIRKEQDRELRNQDGNNTKLYENDNWGELSINAWNASKDIKAKVNEVQQTEEAKRKSQTETMADPSSPLGGLQLPFPPQSLLANGPETAGPSMLSMPPMQSFPGGNNGEFDDFPLDNAFDTTFPSLLDFDDELLFDPYLDDLNAYEFYEALLAEELQEPDGGIKRKREPDEEELHPPTKKKNEIQTIDYDEEPGADFEDFTFSLDVMPPTQDYPSPPPFSLGGPQPYMDEFSSGALNYATGAPTLNQYGFGAPGNPGFSLGLGSVGDQGFPAISGDFGNGGFGGGSYGGGGFGNSEFGGGSYGGGGFGGGFGNGAFGGGSFGNGDFGSTSFGNGAFGGSYFGNEDVGGSAGNSGFSPMPFEFEAAELDDPTFEFGGQPHNFEGFGGSSNLFY